MKSLTFINKRNAGKDFRWYLIATSVFYWTLYGFSVSVRPVRRCGSIVQFPITDVLSPSSASFYNCICKFCPKSRIQGFTFIALFWSRIIKNGRMLWFSETITMVWICCHMSCSLLWLIRSILCSFIHTALTTVMPFKQRRLDKIKCP